MYVTVTALTATYLVYLSKVRWYTVFIGMYYVDFAGNDSFRRYGTTLYLPATMIGDSAPSQQKHKNFEGWGGGHLDVHVIMRVLLNNFVLYPLC